MGIVHRQGWDGMASCSCLEAHERYPKQLHGDTRKHTIGTYCTFNRSGLVRKSPHIVSIVCLPLNLLPLSAVDSADKAAKAEILAPSSPTNYLIRYHN
jgi:hypothetical protein